MKKIAILFLATFLTAVTTSAQEFVDIVYDGENASFTFPPTVTGII